MKFDIYRYKKLYYEDVLKLFLIFYLFLNKVFVYEMICLF